MNAMSFPDITSFLAWNIRIFKKYMSKMGTVLDIPLDLTTNTYRNRRKARMPYRFIDNPNLSCSPDAYDWDGSLLENYRTSPFGEHKDGRIPPTSDTSGKRLRLHNKLWSSIRINPLVKSQLGDGIPIGLFEEVRPFDMKENYNSIHRNKSFPDAVERITPEFDRQVSSGYCREYVALTPPKVVTPMGCVIAIRNNVVKLRATFDATMSGINSSIFAPTMSLPQIPVSYGNRNKGSQKCGPYSSVFILRLPLGS